MILDDNMLGLFLKQRRTRLEAPIGPQATSRRRTRGLRREEIAQRANVSATWYTWLEQGRGGAPSPEALERIAAALELTPAEREHLFLLARRRRPASPYEPDVDLSPRVRHVLDALETSPAYIKTAAEDLVAWNHAATVVMTDYALLPLEERNLLRLLFCDTRIRAKMPHWERDARFAVATFRLEATRVGLAGRVGEVIDDLNRRSVEFHAMWADNDVETYGDGLKHIVHPIVGPLTLEYAAFAVDGRPDLGMVVYTPATPAERETVRALVAGGVDGLSGRPCDSRVVA